MSEFTTHTTVGETPSPAQPLSDLASHATIGQAPPTITVYAHPLCPWAHRIYLLLTHLSIPYTAITIDLTIPRPDWFLALNPRGQIPTLVHGDGPPLYESRIITQFLYHQYYPTPPAAGAMDFAQQDLFVTLLESYLVPPLFRVIQQPLSVEEITTAAEEIVKAMEKWLVPRLAGVGVKFGYAVCCSMGFLGRVWIYSANGGGVLPGWVWERLMKIPEFRGWWEAVMEIESVKASLENREEVLGLARWLCEGNYGKVGRERVMPAEGE